MGKIHKHLGSQQRIESDGPIEEDTILSNDE